MSKRRDMLESAIKHHRDGLYEEARALYLCATGLHFPVAEDAGITTSPDDKILSVDQIVSACLSGCEQADKADNNLVISECIAPALVSRAVSLALDGELDSAIEKIRIIEKLTGNSSAIHNSVFVLSNTLGVSAKMMGRFSESVSFFEKAISLEYYNTETRSRLIEVVKLLYSNQSHNSAEATMLTEFLSDDRRVEQQDDGKIFIDGMNSEIEDILIRNINVVSPHIYRLLYTGISARPSHLTHRQMANKLSSIPRFDWRKYFYYNYIYDSHSLGWDDFNKSECFGAGADNMARSAPPYDMIHYGCGSMLLTGWLNIDTSPFNAENYMQCDLLESHPFPDSSISFGYSDNMVEHFTQSELIFFLSEVFRTLKPGGVIRLCYPSLAGALDYHSPLTSQSVRELELYEYKIWGHQYLAGSDELSLIASKIGFSDVSHVKYRESKHLPLRDIDHHDDKSCPGTFNYVELTR